MESRRGDLCEGAKEVGFTKLRAKFWMESTLVCLYGLHSELNPSTLGRVIRPLLSFLIHARED